MKYLGVGIAVAAAAIAWAWWLHERGHSEPSITPPRTVAGIVSPIDPGMLRTPPNPDPGMVRILENPEAGRPRNTNGGLSGPVVDGDN